MAPPPSVSDDDSDRDEELASMDEAGTSAEQGGDAPSTPDHNGASKRKRGEVASPGAVLDETEIARRRRRRQARAFHKRRKSLTRMPSAGPVQNHQYISDMYSTIIKMSSENKINVKNSWSLHLIDHMGDILDTSEKDAGADDTFNFQKASCTLDASVKIYSYRVDDTWNSSYKILENLSRTEDKHESTADGATSTKTSRKDRKSHAAAKTIETNMNNINLKSYELEFEADPLFHKMSQSFDEGGAKGMLLVNLSVYDGCKILLNSSDVSVSTRKSLSEVKVEPEPALSPIPENEAPKAKGINLDFLGDLSCFTPKIQSLGVCPPLLRLYEQIDEFQGENAPRHKIVMKSDFLSTNAKYRPSLDPGSMGFDFAKSEMSQEDDENDVDPSQSQMDSESQNETQDNDDTPMEDYDIGNNDAADDDNDTGVDDWGNDDCDAPMGDEDHENDPETPSQVDNPEASDEKQIDPMTASAADYFRAKAQENTEQQKEDVDQHSLMIENALVKGSMVDDLADGMDDYSYFDVKMLRNWAGPVHWKFPAVRKVQMKQSQETVSTDPSQLDNADVDEDGINTVSKVATKSRKGSTTNADKKSNIIDFFADEPPSLKDALKAPRTASTLVLSKLMVNRQAQKAAELVFPVDTHVQISSFFQFFMKPKVRFFKRQQPGVVPQFTPGSGLETGRQGGDANNAFTNDMSDPNEFGNGFDDNIGGDFDDGYDHDDDDNAATSASSYTYSSQGLVVAERVVEKIDVHYERFAKRVDVKKLKTSIWDHLEKDTKILDPIKETSVEDESADEPPVQVGQKRRSMSTSDSTTDTTFENVVHNVSDSVPSNVTVSFYFICMLHLANEKGLELIGQDDLSDFKIRKEAE